MNTRRRRVLLPVLALAAVGLFSGCAATHATSYYDSIKRTVIDAKDDLLGTRPTTAELFSEDDTPLIDINDDAADSMLGFFCPPVNGNSPIYVTAFVNSADPGNASLFGQVVADQVAARLAGRGFKITEGPARAVPQGEPRRPKPVSPVLSGEERRDAEAHYQAAIEAPRPCTLTGTYFVAGNVVYVTARITALDDRQVVAAQAWTVPLNGNTATLLAGRGGNGGMTPDVRTSFHGRSPHRIANISGQRQIAVERDLIY